MAITPQNAVDRGSTVPTTLALTVLVFLLSGCADFKAVSEFAQQTTKVTGTVRAEFAQLDAICRDQAELTIVVNNIQDDGPLKTCDDYEASQGRLATVTLDVLENYAKTLAKLADDNAYDATADIDKVSAK